MAEVKKAVCAKCGKEFEQSAGRGRPRKFCADCRAPRAKKVVEPTAPPAV
jgi:protein-arginine kinase activator protein McsA